MKKTIIVLLFVALLVPPAGTAGAASSYTFRGGGWGHGIGASQYGALGLHHKGWSIAKMVRQYYAGTQLQTKNPPANNVRVGLLQNRGSITLRANGGPMDLKLSSNGELIETVPQGDTRTIKISGSKYTIQNGGTVVASGVGGTGSHLRATRAGSNTKIKVSEWGDRRIGRGRVEFRIVSSNSAHLVAVVPFEQYLYGIAEVPASWPAKVQRFQGILARTYAYEKIARLGNNRSNCACGLLATVQDQHYTGWEKEVSSFGDRWVKAVNDTAKRIVTYGGNPIQAYYSSSSGGMVERNDKVWGGTQLPYLKKRCDPGDFTGSNPNRTWSLQLSDTQTATRLRNNLGWGISRVTGFNVLERGPSGRIVSVRVNGRNSSGSSVSFTTTGEGLRRGLQLKSTRFWVNGNRNVTGAIRNRYDNLNCSPGLAKSAQRSAAGGKWQRFAKGRMYTKSGAGTRWIRGLTLKRYLELKGPNGRLGYPKSDVRKLSNGRDRVIFERGRITCKRSTGKCNVRYS